VSILNGEIVALAKASRRQAPVNAGLERLVKAAEGGGRRDYSAAELARELGL
jgi:ketopantoate reductase